jgi:hypothetical protein
VGSSNPPQPSEWLGLQVCTNAPGYKFLLCTFCTMFFSEMNFMSLSNEPVHLCNAIFGLESILPVTNKDMPTFFGLIFF